MKQIKLLFEILLLNLFFSSAHGAEFNLESIYGGFSQRFAPYEAIFQATEGPIDAIHKPGVEGPKIPIGAEISAYPTMACKLDAILGSSKDIEGDLSKFYHHDFLQKGGLAEGTLWHFLQRQNFLSKKNIPLEYRNRLLEMDKSGLVVGSFMGLGLDMKSDRLVLIPQIRNHKIPFVKRLNYARTSNATVKQRAFVLAHPDLDIELADILYSPEFNHDFSSLILQSGFSFWLSSLQYGLASRLIDDAPYNARIFFIEWLAAMYLNELGVLGAKTHVPAQLAKYISNVLQNLESASSAHARLANEGWEFQLYLESDFYIDDEENNVQPTKAQYQILQRRHHRYWDLIDKRHEIRCAFERMDRKANHLPKAELKKLAISTSVALFSVFRISDQTNTPYKNALSRMKELEQITNIDMSIDVLRRIFADFFLD